MTEELDPKFEATLRDLLTKVSAKEVADFRASDSLRDLGLDSVSLAELIVMLEDECKVSLDQREIESVETFGQLQELLQRSS